MNRNRGSASTLSAVAMVASLLLTSAVLPWATPASAWQTAQDLEGDPGFVDFARFGAFDPDAIKLEINISGALLRLLGSAVEEDDGEFAQLLRSLRSIQVNVYDAEESRARAASGSISKVVRGLRDDGWESIVTVRDEGSLHLLVRSNDDLVLGLFAAFTDTEGSIGFLNIVGDFDPVQIGRLARQLDIDVLEGLDLDATLGSSPDEKRVPEEDHR